MAAEVPLTKALDNWWVGAVALLVSLVITPIVRLIAYRAKIVDRPDDLLKPHSRPVAYLGGVAMCAGLLAGVAVFAVAMPSAGLVWKELGEDLISLNIVGIQANPIWNLLAIAVASILITIVGLLDDIFDIKPRKKVYGQMLAAAILLIGGVGQEVARIMFTHMGIPIPPIGILIPINVVFCVVMVIAACNATNLLDGLDGLCGGVTGIVTLGFLALAIHLAMYPHFEIYGTDRLRTGLCLAMAGAVFGFLPYNIPPASIFMGDAGSMLLGFFVATMMLLFCREGHGKFFIAACVIFALPILDTALAVVRRLLSRKSIFAGDRSHLYDQLVDRGMSIRHVVTLFYLLSIAAAVIGVVMAIYMPARFAIGIYAVGLVIIWYIFYRLGMIKPEPRKSETHHDDSEYSDD